MQAVSTTHIRNILARLNGYTEILETLADPAGPIAVEALIFLASELKATIQDLDVAFRQIGHSGQNEEIGVIKLQTSLETNRDEIDNSPA